MNLKTKIIIIIVVIILLIVLFRKKAKAYINKVDLPQEVIEQGTKSLTELTVLANEIKRHLTGITILNEEEYLLKVIELSDIDLLRLHNIYIDLFDTTLYKDFNEDWYWTANNDTLNTLNNKLKQLNLNVQ